MPELSLLDLLIIIFSAAAVIILAWFVLPNLLLRRKPRSKGVSGTLLSFDDGPDPAVTPALLDVLSAHQTRACFFVLAEQAQKHPQLIRRMLHEGHTIGLHGYRHTRPAGLQIRKQWHELRQAYQILCRLGCRPHLYRPPHGFHTLLTYLFCRRYRLRPVHWHGLVRDWLPTDPHVLARRLIQLAGDGHILVLHDGSAGKADPRAHFAVPQATRLFLEQLCLPQHISSDWHALDPVHALAQADRGFTADRPLHPAFRTERCTDPGAAPEGDIF